MNQELEILLGVLIGGVFGSMYSWHFTKQACKAAYRPMRFREKISDFQSRINSKNKEITRLKNKISNLQLLLLDHKSEQENGAHL